MLIRRAEPADARAIAAVHVRSWQAAYAGLMPQDHLDALTPAMRVPLWDRVLRGASSPRTEVLVAEVEGVVAGFAGFGPGRDEDVDPESVAEVSTLYSVPEVWGTGVGRGLVTAVLDALAPAGYAQVTLWVLDTNVRARRFYERAGWRPDGAVQRDESDGFPLTEVRYRRPLDRPGTAPARAGG